MNYSPSGTQFNYFHVCHRKLWLFSNGISMEHTNDLVYEGKLIHKSSYPQRSARFEEVEINGIKVDYYDSVKHVIHEIKRSDTLEEADIWQLKYYIFVFEENGIEVCKGLLEYPRLRITQSVILTEEDRNSICKAVEGIESVIHSEKCPPINRSRICKSCSYFDFCYIMEPDFI